MGLSDGLFKQLETPLNKLADYKDNEKYAEKIDTTDSQVGVKMKFDSLNLHFHIYDKNLLC